MKKEEIVWRLKEQPTSENLRELVKDKILATEEARQILFATRSFDEADERDKNSLKEEIKFLRDLVDKLSQNRTNIIEKIKEVQKPYYKCPWYYPYQVWCSGTQWSSTSTVSQYQTNAGSTAQAQSNFSAINTFN